MKIACIVAAIVAGTFGLSNWRAKSPAHPLSLHISPTADASAFPPIRFSGHVQPRTRVAIRSTVSLPLIDLPVKVGDRVTRGSGTTPPSILARLDDGDLRAALRIAEARRDAQIAEMEVAQVRLTALESQVASNRVCLGEAERSWGRYKQLIANQCVSQAAADEARSKYERLTAEHATAARSHAAGQATLSVMRKNLAAAEAEVERARLALDVATIHSPIDGVVIRVNVAVGEIVTGTGTDPGTVLMEVADMDRMLLVVNVDEESIGKVEAGQQATVHLKGFGQRVFPGTVENIARISTEGKDGSRYVEAIIVLDTRGHRVPAGLSGEAAICPSR